MSVLQASETPKKDVTLPGLNQSIEMPPSNSVAALKQMFESKSKTSKAQKDELEKTFKRSSIVVRKADTTPTMKDKLAVSPFNSGIRTSGLNQSIDFTSSQQFVGSQSVRNLASTYEKGAQQLAQTERTRTKVSVKIASKSTLMKSTTDIEMLKKKEDLNFSQAQDTIISSQRNLNQSQISDTKSDNSSSVLQNGFASIKDNIFIQSDKEKKKKAELDNSQDRMRNSFSRQSNDGIQSIQQYESMTTMRKSFGNEAKDAPPNYYSGTQTKTVFHQPFVKQRATLDAFDSGSNSFKLELKQNQESQPNKQNQSVSQRNSYQEHLFSAEISKVQISDKMSDKQVFQNQPTEYATNRPAYKSAKKVDMSDFQNQAKKPESQDEEVIYDNIDQENKTKQKEQESIVIQSKQKEQEDEDMQNFASPDKVVIQAKEQEASSNKFILEEDTQSQERPKEADKENSSQEINLSYDEQLDQPALCNNEMRKLFVRDNVTREELEVVEAERRQQILKSYVKALKEPSEKVYFQYVARKQILIFQKRLILKQ